MTQDPPDTAALEQEVRELRSMLGDALDRIDVLDRRLAREEPTGSVPPTRGDDEDAVEHGPLGRRQAIKGAVLAAGAAAAGVVVADASPAAAVNGNPVVLGTNGQTATSATTIQVGGSNLTGFGVGDNGLVSQYNPAIFGYAKGTAFSIAVEGYAEGTANALHGLSKGSGAGVVGEAVSAPGVFGTNPTGPGVRGASLNGVGVTGDSNGGATTSGVKGTSTNGRGVHGTSTAESGVLGESVNGVGVTGKSTAKTGVSGTSASTATTAIGVEGVITAGTGVKGTATTGIGVQGTTTTNVGVSGVASNGIAVQAQSSGGSGLFATGATYGIQAVSTGDSTRAAISASSPGAAKGITVETETGAILAGIANQGGGISVVAPQFHLRLLNADARPAPTADPIAHPAGDLVATSTGELWVCVASGTPGTWRKVASPSAAGAFHVLPAPARVYDSRPGSAPSQGPKTKLPASGAARPIDCTVNGSGVPVGATAVALTVLLVNAANGNGNMTVWANGTAKPQSNTMVWGAGAGRWTTSTISALDASAKIQLSASAETDVVIDVVGYYR